MGDYLTLTVNGKNLDIDVSPSAMLVDVLRDQLGLIGTKIGYREGECGACTILWMEQKMAVLENLYRCTGYKRIVEGVTQTVKQVRSNKVFVKRWNKGPSGVI